MGKINGAAVEIIPLDETQPLSCRQNRGDPLISAPHSSSQLQQKMQRTPYMSDPMIINRVQKYLESNVDKTYVDINVMADDLQRRYKEYTRRKQNAFRSAVKKAYSIVLSSYGMTSQNTGSSEDLSDDDSGDNEDVSFQENSLSSQLLEMYSHPLETRQMEVPPPIDISSDDSNEPPYVKQKEPPVINSQPPYAQRIEPEPNKTDRGKKRKHVSEIKVTALPLPKKRKPQTVIQEPRVEFHNIGGIDKILEDVCHLLIPLRQPEIFTQIGVSPIRGILLHGPPGCGKTLLANAIAGELNVKLLKVAGPELVAGVSGESEERIRELFDRAGQNAPCILFIDEIDAITQNRQHAQKDMEKRIVAQILSCFDDLNLNQRQGGVVVIGATNRPDTLDPALRRAGRFDREICMGIPDVKARIQILEVVTNRLHLSDDVDFKELAKLTPGYVGADLTSLAMEAGSAALRRIIDDLTPSTQPQTIDVNSSSTEETASPKPTSKMEVDAPPEKTSEPSETQQANPSPSEPSGSNSNSSKDNKNDPNCGTNGNDSDLPIVVDDEKQQQKQVEVMVDVEVDDVEKIPVSKLDQWINWLQEGIPLSGEQLEQMCVTMEDFREALKRVQPSAKREGFATVPDVTWKNIGSLDGVKEELKTSLLAPVLYAEECASLGMRSSTGILLIGPPGCGKTLLAKAVANEAQFNFISVKGPELLNMYLGESERAVRECFQRARNSAPCVIFFDEFDALCPKRSDARENGATSRIVNQMLTEMDGVESRKNVFILAASNRPDIIDPAVLRPGRLDKILYVGLPGPDDRVEILKTLTNNGKKPLLATDTDLESIGRSEELNNFTGADLAQVVKEASMLALQEHIQNKDSNALAPLVVKPGHFDKAIAKIRPSVSDESRQMYEVMKELYAQ